MARIFRTSDRIPVKIDTITVTIAPLSFDQKTELQTIMMQASADPMYAVKGARLAIKYAVKDITGVETLDGTKYAPEFDGTGNLSDAGVDDLLNMEETAKLIAVCSQLISGIPRAVIDPANGKPMKGVSVELPTSPKAKART